MFQWTPSFTSDLFPSSIPNKILHAFLFSPLRATCPLYLIPLDFITFTVFGEEYKPRMSPLCNCLQPPFASPLQDPCFPITPIKTPSSFRFYCISCTLKLDYFQFSKRMIQGVPYIWRIIIFMYCNLVWVWNSLSRPRSVRGTDCWWSKTGAEENI